MKLWTVIVMVMMAEWGLHYFPWIKVLGPKGLPRIPAYTLGMLAVMCPLTGWLWEQNEVEVIWVLWTVVFAAGITVLALYGLDRYLHLERRDVEAVERDALRDHLDGTPS